MCVIHAPSIYPMCANDCGRRARGRVAGSRCKPCRAAEGDSTVMCLSDGCSNLRFLRGLCRACLSAGKPAKPVRVVQQSSWCKRPGCRNKPHNGEACDKHRADWDTCVLAGCCRTIVEQNKCDKHRPGETGTCMQRYCMSPRFKARLCYRHYNENNPTLCARAECPNATTEVYCRTHDVGIDFAAGDWHDWVAVEQLWSGRLDPERKPTVPELDEMFDRAEQAGIGGATLARQVRVDLNRLRSWRELLGRIERVGAEVAA